MENNMDASISDTSEDSASDEFFHDSIEARKDNRHFSDDGNGERVPSHADLVLDLRNVPTISNIKSDDEMSEKLSAVIEQPEEHITLENKNDESGSIIEGDSDNVLRERINTLQGVIIDLKEEMRLALSMWRKERDEYQSLRERNDILVVEEATAAARAAAEAYAAESPLSNELGNPSAYDNSRNYGIAVNLNPVQSLSELTILEYEKKLAKYQDALALAQAEKRYNMRKKMIANTYRQRLVEVERMCNEELDKIRESTNVLKPLRQIADQWKTKPAQDGGDTNDAVPVEWNPTLCKSEKQQREVTDRYERTYKNGAVDDEVDMTPEVVASRFSYSEASKYGQYGSVKNRARASQSHLLVESNSLPSTWYASTSKC